MASKRKQNLDPGNSNNFRSFSDFQFQTKADFKGTKPLPQPATVSGVLLSTLINLCRRILFVNTNYRVAVYAAILFFSFIGDIAPFPRSYFSQSSNVLNQYFVKLGWFWTLVATIPFIVMTSFTYCCGNKRMVGWHVARMAVATTMWFIFTKSFAYLESNTGRCNAKGEKFATRRACLQAGFFWDSFDISGHAFILIYSSLVIIEEARAIVGWETIANLIRDEEYDRSQKNKLTGPLKNLEDDELSKLKEAFNKYLPYTRAAFIGMTLLTCLWDVMVLSTALYFHTMSEKLISGLLAIAVWYLTYRYWFSRTKFYPYAPGRGKFQYNKPKAASGTPPRSVAASRNKANIGATFMGMPLSTKKPEEEELKPSNGSSTTSTASLKNPPGNNISR